MKCDGHITITEEAFRKVFADCGGDVNTRECDARFTGSNLNMYQGTFKGWDVAQIRCVAASAQSLYAAQMVAGVDAEVTSHYMDRKQAYHFMRATNESELTAYRKGCDFIRDRTTGFVHETSAMLRKMPKPMPAGEDLVFTDQFGEKRALTIFYHSRAGTHKIVHPFARTPFFNPSHLARALHCLQDSFSRGHVDRDSAGRISDIYIFEDQDEKEHGHLDIISGTHKDNPDRKSAVEASADLIKLALRASFRMEVILSEWAAFSQRWLMAGDLSTELPKPKRMKVQ